MDTTRLHRICNLETPSRYKCGPVGPKTRLSLLSFNLFAMHAKTILALGLISVAVSVAKPTVYLIRHGEKPSDGGNGLSAQGLERAQCLRNILGSASSYNIGYIMAQTPKSGTLAAFFWKDL